MVRLGVVGVGGRCISYGNEGYRVGCGVASDKGCRVRCGVALGWGFLGDLHHGVWIRVFWFLLMGPYGIN